MHISAEDSYDFQGLPLSYRWHVLYGDKNTIIEKVDDKPNYVITVPIDPKLPKGRTVILLIVNNGYYDSNPAAINIFRPVGRMNLRPSLNGLENRTIIPGETVEFNIDSKDPDGFPVTLYRWAGEVGALNGNQFSWRCPADAKDGINTVSIIASDGTGSYNSKQVKINVSSTIAQISADTTSGHVPLKVLFSSAGSHDKEGDKLKYLWDFDDGTTSTHQNPSHTFTQPDFYEVVLTVKGPLGEHSSKIMIHARHTWPVRLDNGWDKKGVDKKTWTILPPSNAVTIARSKAKKYLRIYSKQTNSLVDQIGVTSVNNFSIPLYVEASFERFNNRKGTGFKILGNLIGKPDGSKGKDISIGHPKIDGSWETKRIGKFLPGPGKDTQMQLYVNRDPKHRGKIRYTGHINTYIGGFYFKFDNQDQLDDRISILSARKSGVFDITRIQVCFPNGSNR
jgi:hypothetical protein